MSERHYTEYCPHCDEYIVEKFKPLQELFECYESYAKEGNDRDVTNLIDYIRKFENADVFEEQLKVLLFGNRE